jgi:NADH-quinone oxidoreductase subunit J
MNFYALIFYVLGLIIVAATALAITRRNLMHAIVYLVISFLGTALLLYLLGAPFLAVMEVIVYAGAIMVLFLFIVMMLEIKPAEGRTPAAYLRQWLPGVVLGGISAAMTIFLILLALGNILDLKMALASPLAFGRFLFQRYWLAVEIASYLLFVALVGALYLGRRDQAPRG